METIILQFVEKVMPELKEEIEEIILEGEGDISRVIDFIKSSVDELGSNLTRYVIEMIDELIKESASRKKRWVVQSKGNEKTIITKLGEVKYKRTYYKSKGNEGYTYLVDDYLGIERYQRLDNGLSAKIVGLAKDYSYQKSAELAVDSVKLSKQTVKNKIRQLGKVDIKDTKKFKIKEKKKLKKLYVEADEDHISLQSGKSKNEIAKLVYVHEGKKKKGKRVNLNNLYYIAGIYKKTEELWLEVLDYIDKNYDIDAIDTIYLSGDGAKWIKAGLDWLPNAKFVLDRYHLSKYVLKATGHMPSKRFELWHGLNIGDLAKVKAVFKQILRHTEKQTKRKAIINARRYILSNWEGIKIYKKDSNVLGCSAEGHVSHVLSDRMSSRPLGWSIKGADQMARLRAFKFNGGDNKKIQELMHKKNKRKKLDMKIDKIVKNKQKTLFPEAKEIIPVIKKGIVNGTFRAVKSLAF